jgi:hypothetical protein
MPRCSSRMFHLLSLLAAESQCPLSLEQVTDTAEPSVTLSGARVRNDINVAPASEAIIDFITFKTSDIEVITVLETSDVSSASGLSTSRRCCQHLACCLIPECFFRALSAFDFTLFDS